MRERSLSAVLRGLELLEKASPKDRGLFEQNPLVILESAQLRGLLCVSPSKASTGNGGNRSREAPKSRMYGPPCTNNSEGAKARAGAEAFSWMIVWAENLADPKIRLARLHPLHLDNSPRYRHEPLVRLGTLQADFLNFSCPLSFCISLADTTIPPTNVIVWPNGFDSTVSSSLKSSGRHVWLCLTFVC